MRNQIMFKSWKEKGSLKKNRIAVALVFFTNGLLYASWTSRIPELKSITNISNATLGTLLFTIAIGAIMAMPIAGWLSVKIGSNWSTRITSIGFCISVSLLMASSNILFTTFFFFTMGIFSGSMDVSMNGQAVLVERKWRSSIMSSFHALFSIGMALGAGMGSIFAKYQIALNVHLMMMTGIGILICLWSSFYLLPDEKVQVNSKKSGGFVWPTLAILPLGIIAFCGMTGEGSIVDWSALFMKQVVGGSDFMGALSVGSFALAMTLARLFGDYFTNKLGRINMLSIGSALAIAGLGAVLLFNSQLATLVGFFVAGLGLANIVPIVYSSAGNTKGVQPSAGIAMVSIIGYAGFFVGPPVIGYLSEIFDLRIGLSFSAVLLIIMFLMILALHKKLT